MCVGFPEMCCSAETTVGNPVIRNSINFINDKLKYNHMIKDYSFTNTIDELQKCLHRLVKLELNIKNNM